MDMVYGHVAHQEDESEPWHECSVHVVCQGISDNCVDGDGSDATPQIEKTRQVEYCNCYYEGILLPWFCVRYALEHSCERIGQ